MGEKRKNGKTKKGQAWGRETAGRAVKRRKIRRWVFLAFGILAILHAVFAGYYGFRLAALKHANPGMTAIMRLREETRPLDDKGFIPLVEIPEFTKRLVIRAEDFRFYRHFGIDFESILFAIRINSKRGEIVYGGSTISQQLSRTLFLSMNRSYLKKYMEALLAIEAELVLGKERILELYLNCAEWGPGIYGLRRAARYHYGVDVRGLTENQVVRLVTILASPIRVNPRDCEKDRLMGPRYRSLLGGAAAIRGKRIENPSVFQKSN